jgi:SAM-dependent methyltransferase
MNLPMSKVANVKDFEHKDFISCALKYKLNGASDYPTLNKTFLNRKTWEIGMAILSFDKFKLLNKDKVFLGVGAGKEETISILSNYSEKVFATDMYLDQGAWKNWHDGNLLIDARPYMDSRYKHRKVVWQHVDGRELPYEDNSFDGIFSCSSIEHFGEEPDIRQSLEEIYRVLKPGGVAAISSEYKISGQGDGWTGVQLFDAERLQRVWIDDIGWDMVDELDTHIDSTDYVDFERFVKDVEYQQNAYPHIKLDNGHYRWTSVHLTLVK